MRFDYAQLVKVFGTDPESQKRYSPAQCLGIKQEIILGNPDPKHISTSYVERQNLNMLMQMRRFTRLTNALSKKIENHPLSRAVSCSQQLCTGASNPASHTGDGSGASVSMCGRSLTSSTL